MSQEVPGWGRNSIFSVILLVNVFDQYIMSKFVWKDVQQLWCEVLMGRNDADDSRGIASPRMIGLFVSVWNSYYDFFFVALIHKAVCAWVLVSVPVTPLQNILSFSIPTNHIWIFTLVLFGLPDLLAPERRVSNIRALGTKSPNSLSQHGQGPYKLMDSGSCSKNIFPNFVQLGNLIHTIPILER